jgi:hypothetical protein
MQASVRVASDNRSTCEAEIVKEIAMSKFEQTPEG